MDRDVSWLLPHQCRGNYQACLAVLALQAAGALAQGFLRRKTWPEVRSNECDGSPLAGRG